MPVLCISKRLSKVLFQLHTLRSRRRPAPSHAGPVAHASALAFWLDSPIIRLAFKTAQRMFQLQRSSLQLMRLRLVSSATGVHQAPISCSHVYYSSAWGPLTHLQLVAWLHCHYRTRTSSLPHCLAQVRLWSALGLGNVANSESERNPA